MTFSSAGIYFIPYVFLERPSPPSENPKQILQSLLPRRDCELLKATDHVNLVFDLQFKEQYAESRKLRTRHTGLKEQISKQRSISRRPLDNLYFSNQHRNESCHNHQHHGSGSATEAQASKLCRDHRLRLITTLGGKYAVTAGSHQAVSRCLGGLYFPTHPK